MAADEVSPHAYAPILSSGTVCPLVTLREGEWSPKATRPQVEIAIFSWQEIVQCSSGQPAFFLVGNRMTIVAFEKEVSLKAYYKLI